MLDVVEPVGDEPYVVGFISSTNLTIFFTPRILFVMSTACWDCFFVNNPIR